MSRTKFNRALRILLNLCKIKITSAVIITASAGYIMASGRLDTFMIIPMLGTFLLACGSAALNQIQERKSDAFMKRTVGRPLVAGKIKLSTAIIFSSSLVVIGLSTILASAGPMVFYLGLLALIWYNVIYTPLKKLSSLAVVPGALIGSIPPAMGWITGGGSIMDPQIWAIGLFIFIWQIPHFWLLLLLYDDEYKRAGYPTLTKFLNSTQLTRVTYVWIIALVASVMIIPMFGLTQFVSVNILIIISGFRLVWKTRNLVKKDFSSVIFRLAFKEINIFVLLVLIFMSIDRLIGI